MGENTKHKKDYQQNLISEIISFFLYLNLQKYARFGLSIVVVVSPRPLKKMFCSVFFEGRRKVSWNSKLLTWNSVKVELVAKKNKNKKMVKTKTPKTLKSSNYLFVGNGASSVQNAARWEGTKAI